MWNLVVSKLENHNITLEKAINTKFWTRKKKKLQFDQIKNNSDKVRKAIVYFKINFFEKLKLP